MKMKIYGMHFHPDSEVIQREENGQALIELAVTLPLLMVIFLGAVEFARLAHMAMEVSSAAKAAAQYGSQNEAMASDINGIQQTAQQDAPYVANTCSGFTTTVQNSGSPNYQLPCTCVSSGTPSPDPPTYAACSASCTGYVVEVLVVNTSATCSPLIHAPGFPKSFTLHGGAKQEVLN
jgi:Flp pilus assembly protein TadG